MAYNYFGQPAYGNMNYGGYIPQMNYGQQQPPVQPVQPQMQQAQSLPKTNKIFVTSLDDALNRPAEYNSVMVYIHQDKPLLFEITTDPFGKKTHKTFTITPSNNATQVNQNFMITPEMADTFATKKDLKVLSDKIESISKLVKTPSDTTPDLDETIE